MDEKMINNELNALISLLDEPDAAIFNRIRERLFSYGVSAVPLLENAWDTSYNNSDVQKRIEDIIHDIQFDNVFQSLIKWKQTPQQDLLTGFLHLSRFHDPDLNDTEITNKIGMIIQDIWLELNDNLTPLEKVKVINHIFFEVHAFSFNKADVDSPANSWLNLLLETKKGNPVSLAILYIIVSQSLKIPVFGVNLPQNFVLTYIDHMPENIRNLDRRNILFYINPANKGAVFTQREVDLFLRQIGLEVNNKYFLPCDNVTIIRRLVNTLIVSFEKKSNLEKAAELKKLQEALE
ncbi:MAG TPA: transglutaminase-like domain-containing protein [Bacteroidales bacterium]|nr:transglutaminase-like domain-containing protein [Bacteroidales bacterium]